MDISQTLSTMSSTLQVLAISLETEKTQHLELLKNLNQHLIHSQENIQGEVTDLINQIELSELITTVNQSRQNLQKQQNNIQLLNTEITLMSKSVANSIDLLDQKTILLTQKMDKDRQSIGARLIQNISLDVKREITTEFTKQFKDQNQALISEIEAAGKVATKSAIEVYSQMISQINGIKSNHTKSLRSFENHVHSFNAEISSAIENIDHAFLSVKEKNKQNMDELFEACTDFQEKVLKKLNTETDQINQIFDDKIRDLSNKVKSGLDQSLQRMDETEKEIRQKTQNIIQNTKTSLGLTQTIIEKQESVYKTICDKLTFKYFSLNMVCGLLIVFTVVFGLNIAALIKHTQISEQNQILVNEQEKLTAQNQQLSVINQDLTKMSKMSRTELKKKEPNLVFAFNCKSLN